MFQQPFLIFFAGLVAALGLLLQASNAGAQSGSGYGLKVFRADVSLYPFVQVYLRTFDGQWAFL
jgi:hypothetical protein